MACAFSPSGDLFVTGSSCGDLTVWDDKMKCLHSEKAHDLGITCCDFSSQLVSDGEQSSVFSLGNMRAGLPDQNLGCSSEPHLRF